MNSKRSYRQPVAAGYHREGPTPEFRRHHAVAEELVQHDGDTLPGQDGMSKSYADRVLDQTALDALKARGSITEDQHKAGARFHEDHYAAGYVQGQAADFDRIRVDGGGFTGSATFRLEAQERVRQAKRALGSKQAEIAVEVCVWGTRLKALEHALTMSKNAGIDVVRLVLDRLDEHYGDMS